MRKSLRGKGLSFDDDQKSGNRAGSGAQVFCPGVGGKRAAAPQRGKNVSKTEGAASPLPPAAEIAQASSVGRFADDRLAPLRLLERAAATHPDPECRALLLEAIQKAQAGATWGEAHSLPSDWRVRDGDRRCAMLMLDGGLSTLQLEGELLKGAKSAYGTEIVQILRLKNGPLGERQLRRILRRAEADILTVEKSGRTAAV